MRKSMALLVLTLVLAGCGSHDKTEELQQEKITLDLMKAQNEQLTAMMKSQKEQLANLTQKEEGLRALEKKNQDAFREIEREKESLQSIQKHMAQEEVKLKAEEERLEAFRNKLRADELKNQQVQREIAVNRAEVERKLSVIRETEEKQRQAQERERSVVAIARRAEEQKRQQIIAERIKKREPFLNELATKLAGILATGTKMPKSSYRQELLKILMSPGVVQLEEDDVFVHAIGAAMQKYLWDKGLIVSNHISKDDWYKALNEVKKNYLKLRCGEERGSLLGHSCRHRHRDG